MYVPIFMLLALQKVSEKSVFDDVIQDVSDLCPSIDLPWLDVEIGLANIKQSCVQSDDKGEQSAVSEQSDTVYMSSANGTSQSAAAVADYSHLYIYKKDANMTASWSQKTQDYIALSSSSSDEDENECQSVQFAVTSCNDDNDNADNGDAVTVPAVAAADNTATSSIRRVKHSQLYRSPNTGVQIANPNKKKKKSRRA